MEIAKRTRAGGHDPDRAERLAELGYNPGGNDGLMGPLTKGAVLAFRNDNGLVVKDEIDAEFLAALATAKPRAMAPALRRRLQVHVIGAPSGSGLAAPRQLQQLADRLGIADLVRFLPPVPPAELAEHYRAADVVVVPSHNESFGLVALEAQACGTPVVAAALGGLTTAVRDGFSGVLVDGHRPADYAAAIRAVIGRAPLLSAGARRHAVQFSWDRTAATLVESVADAIRASIGIPSPDKPSG